MKAKMSKLLVATLIMTAPLSTIGFAAPSNSIVAMVSDSQAVANDLAAVVAGMQQQGQNLTHVTTNLTLPTAGDNGSTITWSSSNAKVVDASGHVVRPHNYQSDAHLTLTATFSKGNVKRTKTFNVTVQKNDKSDADSVAAEQDLLTGQTILASNRSLDAVTGKLNLPTTGDKKTGTTIVWSSNNTDFVSATGAVKRPSYLQDDQHVTLTATISSGETQATKTFDVTVKKLDPVTEAEKLAYARDTLMFASIKGGNADSDHVTTKLNLLKQAANGVKITWSADQAVSPTGVVTRPSYTAGDVDVVLTATLSLSNKSEPVTKTFHLKVLKNTPVTDLERVTADALALTDNTIKKQNGDLSNVTGNLSLQVSGQNRSTITWTSSDAATINPKNGVVTRPSYSAGDKSVDLTATIKMHDSSETKTFHVTVLKAEPNNNAEWVQKTISTLTLGDTSAVTSDLSLPTSAPNGIKIDWESSNPAVVSKAGKVTRPAYLTGDQTLSLIATVHKGNSSQSKEFSVTVTKLPESKGEAVSIANDAIAAVPDADLITVDTFSDAYEKVQTAHDDIKAATDLGAVDADFVGMDRLVAADAKINGILNQQAVAADVSSLALQYAGDESASGVKSNIVLPTSGSAGSTITWETSDANVVATDGTVTRPAVGAGSATATLTATISKGAATDTKQFTLTVLERDAVKVQLLSINDLHGKIDQTYQED
ncbi:MAG: immunoglobulin-like domain-containing protein, partial [Tumebacillaceae bacterium]